MIRFKTSRSNWLKGALGISLAAANYCAAADLRLIEAIKHRNIQAVEALVSNEADIDAAAPDGATALSWAVFLDLHEIAEKLIAKGAKVNTAGDYGETPLTLALANGNAELAQRLVKAGADWKATRWNGETPLMIAAGAGSVDEVRMLLDLGADVNGTDPNRQQNALMWAASEGHVDVMNLLLERGAKVNAATKTGFTPLVFATLKNDDPSVRRLLRAGADPNFALADQTRILAVAMASKSYAAALALLDGGADSNVTDRAGNTPLHVAAQTGSLELVKKLLAKGAKTDVRTPPAAPSQNQFRPVFGAQTPLLLAARNGQVEVMRTLIEAGADTKLTGDDGAPLLLAAAASGRVAAAKYAFEFDKNVTAKDKNGRTAMHAVVGSGGGGATQDQMTETVQYLAEIGVPLDEKDGRGRTPIQTGDGIPLDKPIQRMAEIIVSRGGTPIAFPKEYRKPEASR